MGTKINPPFPLWKKNTRMRKKTKNLPEIKLSSQKNPLSFFNCKNTQKGYGYLRLINAFSNSSYSQLCIGQIEASTCPPPRQPLEHLTFLKIIVQIPPYLGQNAVQMPHTMIHLGDQMPPPRGRFTGTKLSEGRRKRLQLSNKIFINITKLRNTVSVFTKNKSLVQSGGNRCYKLTECSKRSIKKDPAY